MNQLAHHAVEVWNGVMLHSRLWFVRFFCQVFVVCVHFVGEQLEPVDVVVGLWTWIRRHKTDNNSCTWTHAITGQRGTSSNCTVVIFTPWVWCTMIWVGVVEFVFAQIHTCDTCDRFHTCLFSSFYIRLCCHHLGKDSKTSSVCTCQC